MKATMLKISAPFEILSSTLGPHKLINVANKVTHQATRTVCHLWISYEGLTRFACPRMKLLQTKLLVAPIARIPEIPKLVFNVAELKDSILDLFWLTNYHKPSCEIRELSANTLWREYINPRILSTSNRVFRAHLCHGIYHAEGHKTDPNPSPDHDWGPTGRDTCHKNAS